MTDMLTVNLLLIISVLVFLTFCAFAIKIYSNNIREKNANKKEDINFCENNICSRCKTGRESLKIDPLSGVCPYIVSWKDGKCYFFKELDDSKEIKTSLKQ